MLAPTVPENEQARMETLRALRILDTAPEERFDRITRMARRIFGVPISLVSLVDTDRQWFKSAQGLGATETPRNVSFCGHAILGEGVFVVPNALDDERFVDNPLVAKDPHIRFYAGSPIKAANGHKVGTLCLIDREPRRLDEEDKLLLQDLGVMIEQEIAAMQLATLDELTGISNRRGLMELAVHALSMCKRQGSDAVLLGIDLNDFKPINDTHGHAEGDRALIAFSDLLKECFRDSDVFARVGGDEFIALLTHTAPGEADRAIERLQQAVSDYNGVAKRGYELSFSVGCAHFTGKETLESLMEIADQAMYENKRARKMNVAR